LNRTDEIIPHLVSAGMDGIECFHTKHSNSATRRYLEIADKLKLLVTGGSDCHGKSKGKPLIGTVKPMAAAAMLLFTIGCQLAPQGMIRFFSQDPAVVAVGSEYLRIVSWNFVASGVIFVNASTFQAIGNTIPPLVASFIRILLVAIPAFLVVRLPGFDLRWIWYISVGSVMLQLVMNLFLLRREFRLRLQFAQ
jgi:hypothetical protein